MRNLFKSRSTLIRERIWHWEHKRRLVQFDIWAINLMDHLEPFEKELKVLSIECACLERLINRLYKKLTKK